MRALMPRLVKDAKSGIWFFRWSLPKPHQKNLNQKTLYTSLQTRDARLPRWSVWMAYRRLSISAAMGMGPWDVGRYWLCPALWLPPMPYSPSRLPSSSYT